MSKLHNEKIPVISIVGRPNVGKSSLFNRLAGSRLAVVEEKGGTTRDRNEKVVSIRGKSFILVDTGGFIAKDKDEISVLVRREIEKAVKLSDLLLFVSDGMAFSPLDEELSDRLRKSGKKIILVVNKIDNEMIKEGIFDFYRLGLGEPYAVSCLHNIGISELIDEILALAPKAREIPEGTIPIKVAIVGRPNVGKSSFLNKVLGEERTIVHEAPGTTRDSVDSFFEKDGIPFLLIDTAGIRHKRKVKEAVDVYSMMRARDSIDRSDITFLLLDSAEGVSVDDAKIFRYIKEKGKGCLILANKWDLVKGVEMSRYKEAIIRRMPEARNFPIEFISAKTGRNVQKAFDLVKSIKTSLDLFINTSTLKDFLKKIKPENVRIPRKRFIPRFYYMAQIRSNPSEFLVFVDNPRNVTGLHTAFIENRLREQFPFKGVPIRIMYRKLHKR